MDTHRCGMMLFSQKTFDEVTFLRSEFEEHREDEFILQEEILIYLANLKNNDETYNAIKRCFNIPRNDLTIEEYAIEAFIKIRDISEVDITSLIVLDWENRNDSDSCTTLEDAKVFLENSLEGACIMALPYVKALCLDSNRENDSLSMPKTAILINAAERLFHPTIKYVPIPAISKETGELMYCDGYYVYSTQDAVYLHFVNTVKNRVKIKQCKICGNFFIPTSKRDEIYCKSCRKTTYDTKIQNDNILKTYRKIYKTQNARKQRNSHIQNINYRFDCWKENAKVVVQLCQSGKLAVEEMKHLISSDSWIKGILPDLQQLKVEVHHNNTDVQP